MIKPGGQIRLYEYVRGNQAVLGLLTDVVTPVWRRVGAGCHPNRDTARAIQEAGFAFERLEWLCPFEIKGKV